MADETTPLLGLVKPEVNGPQTENVWGFDLNANFDKIDAQFALLPASDAPMDGDIYGRRQGAWSRTVLATDFAQLQSDLATHTHTDADITNFAEAVDDRVATVLRAGANIVLTYDDVVNQLVIASTGGGGGGGSLPPDGDYGDIVVSASGTHWTLDLTDVTLPTGDYGDITVSPGKVWTIDPGAVTYAKIQNVAANKLLGTLTAGPVTEITCTAAARAFLNDVDAVEQRATLGLGTAAVANATAFQPADPTLLALSALDSTPGLLEETSLDFFAKRPIGVATPTSIPDRAAADTRYAPIDNPLFTGDARAVTPATADNDTSIATTAFVKAQGYAAGTHTHAIADVTNLQTSLDAKANLAGASFTGPVIVGHAGVATGVLTGIAGAYITPDGDLLSECPGVSLNLNRLIANGGVVNFWQGVANFCGSITVADGVSTAYNTSSSAELKEDLQSFDAGRIIDNTEVYDFKWKELDKRAYGVIAQQAVEVYPLAVTHDEENDWWGVDYSKYVPVLLQELKAVRARLAELEAVVVPKKGH